MLSFLLVAAAPAKAGTVHYADAVHVPAGGARGSSDVRLRVAPQTGAAVAAQQQQTAQQRGGGTTSSPQQTGSDAATAPAGPGTTSTISQTGGGQVETVDLGDVTGTVCDCGEIPVVRTPGGGFPLWPFLGLLGVPLAFIPGGDDRTPTPPTGPTPTQPSTPVPEPATLLLFGSSLLALGASARRRLSRRREDEAAVVAEEVI